MVGDAEEDFGFGSDDDAGLLELANTLDAPSTKRKAEDGDLPAPKRFKFPSAERALVQNFRFEKFQLKQEQVISRILGGNSAAVVFPTGGGKSLCYQIPALVFAEEDEITGIRGPGEHGITLVVSPLIALMKDQVDALVRKGIKAATLDSTKSREEYMDTCKQLRDGELKLLYCAPERLNNEGFVEQMKYVRGGVRLLAVDEAHCVSEWGHAFRPDYLKVSRFVEEIHAERVVCLTATATPRVASDICKAFHIDEPEGLFRTSTYRPNLQLIAESGKTKEELLPRLYQFLKSNPGASIVYVTLQKHTDHLATKLRAQGFNARSFHAGLGIPLKTDLQEEFMLKNDLIIVATIAFGMGIDKANIRNVVHFNIPSSLESYSQEIGRAGRDGKLSKCMFYICGEDLHLRELFARGDLPDKGSIRSLLTEIFNPTNARLPIGGEMRFSHYSQEREHDIRPTTLKNIYAQLELTHNLIRAVTPVYTKYQYLACPLYDASLNSDRSIEASAILKFAKKASKFHHIDIEDAAMRSGLNRQAIVHKLNDLNELGALELKPAGVMNVYKVLKKLPRTGPEIEKYVDAIFTLIESREQDALQRTDQMLQLITSEACFSKALAHHFGDTLPNGKQECGHCTWCMTHKQVVQEMPPPAPFNDSLFQEILEAVDVRDDARFLAKFAFGINSPRMTVMKIGKSPLFGSMADHDFMDLLHAFEKACEEDH